MNLAQKRSLIITNILLLVIIFGKFSTFGPKSPFLFSRNMTYNQHKDNWVPKHHAFQLMKGALENNSILITEGGDNEVFPILYFVEVENTQGNNRDFFDQNGNVFPRLYGDMYNPPYDLSIIRNLRDFQLYSTDKPVYLTWKKSLNHLTFKALKKEHQELVSKNSNNPNKSKFNTLGTSITDLKSMESMLDQMVPKSIYSGQFRNHNLISDHDFKSFGPWYSKQQGLLFKVTDIKYSIVDAIELFGPLTLVELQREFPHFSGGFKSPLNWDHTLLSLENEGWIQKKNNQYHLLRPVSELSHEDYFNSYNTDYLSTPHSPYWDELTVAIIVYQVKLYVEYYKDQISHLRRSISLFSEDRQKILQDKLLDMQNRSINKIIEHEPYYSYLSGYLQMSKILVFLGKYDKAIEYLNKLEVLPNQPYSFYQIGEIYRNLSDHGNEVDFVNQSIAAFQKALNAIDLSATQRNISSKQTRDYEAISRQIYISKMLLKYPKKDLDELKSKAVNQPTIDNYLTLARIMKEVLNYDSSLNYYNLAFNASPSQEQIFTINLEKYDILKRTQYLEEAYLSLKLIFSDPLFFNLPNKENYTKDLFYFMSQLANLAIESNYPKVLLNIYNDATILIKTHSNHIPAIKEYEKNLPSLMQAYQSLINNLQK